MTEKLTPQTGDFVKIVRDGERFWIEVTGTHDDGSRMGRVNNNCVVAPYKLGDEIRFKDDEVIDVYGK